MSLIVTALIVGGSAVVASVTAGLVNRRRKRRAAEARAAEAVPPRRDPLVDAGFELQQGDVISVGGRELWLESGWLLREAGEPVAAILFAREAVVVALPKPRPRLYALAEAALGFSADPPSSLDHEGVRYERARRLPVEIEPLDKSPEPPWNDALLVEYRGLGNHSLWALAHSGACKAWAGRVVDAAEIENWGGGASTLEG